MSILNISIPQVRPVKLTYPRFDPDEVYVAYLVHLANTADGKLGHAAAGGCLSTVHRTNGKPPLKAWKPTSAHGEVPGLASAVDIGDADAAVVTMCLFECDDQAIWKEMLGQGDPLREFCKPEDVVWKDIPLPSLCVGATSPQERIICIIRQVVKYAAIAFRHLKQDDLLGSKQMVIHAADDPYTTSDLGTNELVFKGRGGEYRMTVDINLAR